MPMNPDFHVNFVPMKVWSDDGIPSVDMPILTLENPNGLLFFLESLMHGNSMFPAGELFRIAAYQGSMQIGYGTYYVQFNDVGDRTLQGDPEPVKLHPIVESGEIGIVREAWEHVNHILFAGEEENAD